MLLTLPIPNINRIGGKYRLLQATLRPVSSVGGFTRLPSPIRQTLIVFIVISTSICIVFHLTLPVVQDCIASPSILFQVHATPSAPFRRKTVAFVYLSFIFGVSVTVLTKARPDSILLNGNSFFRLPQSKIHLPKKSYVVAWCHSLTSYRCQSSINCFYSFNAM